MTTTIIEHAYWLGANIQFAAHALTSGDRTSSVKELTDAIGHAEKLNLSNELISALEETRRAIQNNIYTPVTCVNYIFRIGQTAGEELRGLYDSRRVDCATSSVTAEDAYARSLLRG